MLTKKSILFLLILLLLTSGCATPAPGTPVPTGMNTPIAPASPTASAEAQVVPTQDAQPDLIKVGLLDSFRVIPANLDPVSQAQEITSQYRSVTTGSSETWAGGTVMAGHRFSLVIDSLSQSAQESITLKVPIHLTITAANTSADGLNILAPMGGGGGGGITFPVMPLKPGEFDLMPDNPGPVILTADMPGNSYDLDMSCQQAGVFDLKFNIPYAVSAAAGTQERAMIYSISLACPQNETVWMLDSVTGQITNRGQWALQNGQYTK